MIPDEEIERIREAADIVAVIGEHVNLRRVGTDFRGPCPFHQGTHRNFSVSPRRGNYKCFVCGEAGDVFTFVRKRLGVDWPSAVRLVAQKTGLELREVRSQREGPDPREPLWEATAAALYYFERVLWDDPGGTVARDYLASRDVSRDLAERFHLGYAPREIGLMRAALATLGFDDQRLLDAGLLVRHEDAEEPRPRFRERLTFPIHDLSSRVAGFGGRLLRDGEPKYLNSGESVLFSKGKMLYGLHTAKNAMRRAERGLVVEGYFDAMRIVNAGVEEVVAPLGTALTSDQAILLTRYTKNIFLLYDSDKAGQKATFRSGDELLRQGASVRVVTLPEGEDPDTFVHKGGGDALERALAEAMDLFDRKVQILQRGGWFADLHRRRKAIDHLLPTIRAAADPVTRDMYVARAAEATGVARDVLMDEVGDGTAPLPRARWQPEAGARQARRPVPEAQQVPRRAVRGEPRKPVSVAGISSERELVRAMLRFPSQKERITEQVGPDQFRDPRYREIFTSLLRLGSDALPDAIGASLAPDAVAELDRLTSEPDAIQDSTVQQTVRHCILNIQIRDLEERSAELQQLLPAATDAEKDRLIREKEEIRDEVRRLSEAGVSP